FLPLTFLHDLDKEIWIGSRFPGEGGGGGGEYRAENKEKRGMGEDLLITLSIENHHRSTLLSMDPSGGTVSSSFHEDSDRELLIQHQQVVLSVAPDINLPLSVEHSPSQQSWNSDTGDILDVGLGPQICDAETTRRIPKATASRKCSKRRDGIWGAWFFFSFFFKPMLSEKSKGKVIRHDVFLVQHDMENMYMWVFKERPENALGKMQLRSYMNGHCRPGEPQFPFSVDRGFVRSHKMQRKKYRGLSNPQCVHGIEVVRSPSLLKAVREVDRKKWMELTGRDLDFSIPPEASDFESWRNQPSTEIELQRRPPPPKSTSHAHPESLSSSQSNHCNGDGMDRSSVCSKRRKDFFLPAMDEDRDQVEPSWVSEFTGVMRHAYGPVTAAKTIYEDDDGYLIMISLPFADQQRVKVLWRNSVMHGILKIICVSTARTPYIKRHDRTFKLTDPSPEHCPPGEFVREITLPMRIPEDANLEAYYDESGALLEIMVPKHRTGAEEHEVHVCILRPHHR
ncbi:hypothetical protein GW17_00038060, partial [Ensete ventricosum]